MSSPQAASRSEQGANGSIRYNRSPCRRRISRLTTILCDTVRFGCSWSGGGRRRAPHRSASRRWPPVSTIASVCSPAGRRTAPPRHQALRATLDWSYELLLEPERVLLRRLAIFAGPFSLEAAAAVAAGPDLAASDVIDMISSLLTKSLVTTATGGGIARYRLLDTTRAYAIEKLDESAESERI